MWVRPKSVQVPHTDSLLRSQVPREPYPTQSIPSPALSPRTTVPCTRERVGSGEHIA